jgi:hypothetical protein
MMMGIIIYMFRAGSVSNGAPHDIVTETPQDKTLILI